MIKYSMVNICTSCDDLYNVCRCMFQLCIISVHSINVPYDLLTDGTTHSRPTFGGGQDVHT